jgi:hypothetical protein
VVKVCNGKAVKEIGDIREITLGLLVGGTIG